MWRVFLGIAMDRVCTGRWREYSGEHTDMGTAARQLALLQKVLAWGDAWRSSRIDRSLLVQTLPENALVEILREADSGESFGDR